MIYFHGMNSHGGSSGYLGTKVSEACCINVYALDFTNFGLSGGTTRGYIESFEDVLEEAEAFVDFVMSQQNNKPKCILAGLSFGGTICFKLAITKPQAYHYLVLFSPALRGVKESMPFMKQVAKAIGYLLPTVKLLEPKFVDGNKYDMSEHIKGEPRNYLGRLIPGSVRNILNAIEEIESQYASLTTPYLLIQSGVDKMVDLFAPLDLELQANVQDKTTIYCKDMWHSVFSEEEI